MGIEVFFNSDGTGVTAVITVINVSGDHVDPDSWPITNDPAIVLSSHPSAAKTITKVDTGVYTAEWSSLSPALSNGDIVNIAIDGAISGVAWSTWRSFLQVMRLPASQSSVDTVDTVVDAIKVKTDQLTFTVANQVDANALGGGGDDAATIYTYFTTGTNEDAFKADVSSLASQASVNGLNDISAADVYTHFTTGTNEDAFKADVSALATSASIAALNNLSSADVTAAVPTVGQTADAVWDEALSGHNVAGSVGKAIRQVKEATITVESSVNDLSATTTSFVTDLTETTDDFYNDKVLVFNSGTLSGQARVISDYNGTTKAITLDEAVTSAPSDADSFIILATHEHSIAQIQSGLATSAALATVDSNVDAILVDTGTTLPATLSTLEGKVDTVDTVVDAVKLKTDLIPASFNTEWANVYDVQITGITTTVETAAGKHSVAGTVMMSTNASLAGGVLTAKKPSDDTTFQTYTITTSASADNITGVS